MRFTKYLTAHYLITILALVLLVFLIVPFPTREVPAWKVLLIDENYLPGGNRTLVQRIDNGYFRHHTEYKAETDKNGFASFPERVIWAGTIHRLGAFGAAILGYETTTKVTIKTESGCEQGAINWNSGDGTGALPDKLVCP